MKGTKNNGNIKGNPKETNPLKNFLKSENQAAGFIRDIIFVLCAVGAIALVLLLVSGTWPAVVAVESESMIPNMNVGDLVFVVAPDRFGELQTWEEGMNTGYAKFGDSPDRQGNTVFGDVIIYRPNGDDNVHPIIHRAIQWYDGEPNSGYITKGDNNQIPDQLSGIADIGAIEPVKKEWVVGKALFSVPLVGYAPLHIFEFAVILIAIMIIHELYLRWREENRK